MKKLLFTMAFILFGTVGVMAQAAIVNDPINYAGIMEVVVKGQEQINAVQEQVKLAKQIKDKVEKVNDAVKTLEMAENAITKSARTITRINKLMNALKETEGLSPSYLRMCSSRCNDAIKAVIDNVSYVDKILGTGFSMNDRERIVSMKETMEEVERASISVDKLYRKATGLSKMKNLIRWE